MPWHREGEVLDDYPGPGRGPRPGRAGLGAHHHRCVRGDRRQPRRQPLLEPLGGWKAIRRSDTGTVLSVNKDSYTVIGHGEMGEIAEAVLAQPSVKWETAGVLDGGRAVWCLALLDEPVELPGDDSATLPYLAITNRHDGTAACALRATAVRIVCANTFRAAELEGERTGATPPSSTSPPGAPGSMSPPGRHRRPARDAPLHRTRPPAARHPDTPKQRELFVTEFIPMPPTGLVTDRVARNVEEARARFGSSSNRRPPRRSLALPTG